MEGFKNLVPQYALVRRNGGEKLTVSFLFADKDNDKDKDKDNDKDQDKNLWRKNHREKDSDRDVDSHCLLDRDDIITI